MLDIDEIRDVHGKTVRVRANAGVVPDNSSFYYKSNEFPVKKGTYYHIHYTNDFKEVYMTGRKHQVNSRIIIPIFKKTKYQQYAEMPSNNYTLLQPPMVRGLPKKSDYIAGSFTRYFAKKVNDESAAIVEVSSEFSSALYNVIEVPWKLRGNPNVVQRANESTTERYKISYPQIAKALSNPLEFVRVPELNETLIERGKLGILDAPKDAKGNIIFDPSLTPPAKMALDEGPGKFKMKGPKKGGGIGKIKFNKSAIAKYGAGGGGSGGGGGY